MIDRAIPVVSPTNNRGTVVGRHGQRSRFGQAKVRLYGLVDDLLGVIEAVGYGNSTCECDAKLLIFRVLVTRSPVKLLIPVVFDTVSRNCD
jgi:hypothetical protein